MTATSVTGVELLRIPNDGVKRFGTAPQVCFSCLLPTPDLDKTGLDRIVRAARIALTNHPISGADVQVSAYGSSVVLTLRLSLTAVESTALALSSWRSATADALLDVPLRRLAGRPGTLTGLADVLMVAPPEIGDELNSAGTTDMCAVVLGRAVNVYVAGGASENLLAIARVRVIHALRTVDVYESPVGYRSSVDFATGKAKLSGSSWVTLPRSGSPLVRLSRETWTCRDEQRGALSMANLMFGGVFNSGLVRYVRQARGLSYSCASQLRKIYGLPMLVIDVRTGPGSERQCVAAVVGAIREFRNSRLTSADVDEARDYLIGRALVETDTLLAQCLPTFESKSVADQLGSITTREVEHQIDYHFRSHEFDRLVISSTECPKGWKEIGR